MVDQGGGKALKIQWNYGTPNGPVLVTKSGFNRGNNLELTFKTWRDVGSMEYGIAGGFKSVNNYPTDYASQAYVAAGLNGRQGDVRTIGWNEDGVANGQGQNQTCPAVQTGFIDAIAALFESGIILPNGRFNMDHPHPRLKSSEEGIEFVLVQADQSETGRDIVITEYDISNLIKSKAAVFAAATVLVQSVGMGFSDIERIFVAGGFGNYLNIQKAISMGLLPDLPMERFQFIGNSSVAGARIALVSNHALEKAQSIAKRMTYFELSVSHDFMNEFIAALFLPHTNQELFPTVAGSGS